MIPSEISHIFNAIDFIRQDIFYILTTAWPQLDPSLRLEILEVDNTKRCQLAQAFAEEHGNAELAWLQQQLSAQQQLLKRMRDNCNRWEILLEQGEQAIAHLREQGEWDDTELTRWQQQLQRTRHTSHPAQLTELAARQPCLLNKETIALSYMDALRWTQIHQARLTALQTQFTTHYPVSVSAPALVSNKRRVDTDCVTTLTALYRELKSHVVQGGALLRVFAEAAEELAGELPSLEDIERLGKALQGVEDYQQLNELEQQIQGYQEPLHDIITLYEQLRHHSHRITELENQLQPFLCDLTLRSHLNAQAVFKEINQDYHELRVAISGLRAAMVVGLINGKSEAVRQMSALAKTLVSLRYVVCLLEIRRRHVETTRVNATKRLEEVRVFLEQTTTPDIDLQLDNVWKVRVAHVSTTTAFSTLLELLRTLQQDIHTLETERHCNRLLLGKLADHHAFVTRLIVSDKEAAQHAHLLKAVQQACQDWDHQLIFTGMLENLVDVQFELQRLVKHVIQCELEACQTACAELKTRVQGIEPHYRAVNLDCLLYGRYDAVDVSNVLQQQQVKFPALQNCLQDMTVLIADYQSLLTKVTQVKQRLDTVMAQIDTLLPQTELCAVKDYLQAELQPFVDSLHAKITQLKLNHADIDYCLEQVTKITLQRIEEDFDIERPMLDILVEHSNQLAGYYHTDPNIVDVSTWKILKKHSKPILQKIKQYLKILYTMPDNTTQQIQIRRMRAALETYYQQLNRMHGNHVIQLLGEAAWQIRYGELPRTLFSTLLADPWCLHALLKYPDAVRQFRALHATVVDHVSAELVAHARQCFIALPAAEACTVTTPHPQRVNFDQYVQKLRDYVRLDILQQTDLTVRTFYFEHWIWIAHACQEQGDYASCAAILSAFASSDLKRLRSTCAGLSTAARDAWEALQDTCTSAQHYLALRLKWEREMGEQVIVPYLAAYDAVCRAQATGSADERPPFYDLIAQMQTRVQQQEVVQTDEQPTPFIQLLCVTQIDKDAAYTLSLQNEAKGSETQASRALQRIGQSITQPGDGALLDDIVTETQQRWLGELYNCKLVQAIKADTCSVAHLTEIDVIHLNQLSNQAYTQEEFQQILKQLKLVFDEETLLEIYQENQRLRYQHQLINPVLRNYIAEQWLRRYTQGSYTNTWLDLQPSIELIHEINQTIFMPVTNKQLQAKLVQFGLHDMSRDEIEAVQIANHALRSLAEQKEYTSQASVSMHAFYHFVRYHPGQAVAGAVLGGALVKFIPVAFAVKSLLLLKAALVAKFGVGAASGTAIAQKRQMAHEKKLQQHITDALAIQAHPGMLTTAEIFFSQLRAQLQHVKQRQSNGFAAGAEKSETVSESDTTVVG